MSANPWIQYVKAVRQANPHLSYKECLQAASQSYTRTTPQRAKPAPKKRGIRGGGMENMNELKAGLRASYKPNPEAADILSEMGYSLDFQLSGQRAKVFTDSNGKPYISFRGTQNMHDVGTDAKAYLGLGLGERSKRVAHTKQVVQQVRDKYGVEPTVIGHSLGGWLAEQSGGKGDVVTYNKMATGRSVGNKKQTDVRTTNDVASAITMLVKPRKNKTISIKNKSWNPLVSHGTKALKMKNMF